MPVRSDVSAREMVARASAVLLESLFYPGQHFLAQQHLVGAGNEPSAFSGIRAIGAGTCFLVAKVCFFGLGSPLLTVFKSFIPFGNFFT